MSCNRKFNVSYIYSLVIVLQFLLCARTSHCQLGHVQHYRTTTALIVRLTITRTVTVHAPIRMSTTFPATMVLISGAYPLDIDQSVTDYPYDNLAAARSQM